MQKLLSKIKYEVKVFVVLLLIAISILLLNISLIAQDIIQPLPAVHTISQPGVSPASQRQPETESSSVLVIAGTSLNNSSNSFFLPPPGNDNYCSGLNAAYTLAPGSACISGTVGGSGGGSSTIQSGETFGCCSPNPTKSVWYSFVATQASMYVTLYSTGAVVCSQNFGILVYRYTGGCPAPGNTPPVGAAGCKNYAAYGSGIGQEVFTNCNLTGLTIGATYLVQIIQNPGCPGSTNSFCISLGIPANCTTCSSPCGPICNFNQVTQPSVPTVTSTCPSYPAAPPMNNSDTRTKCFTFTATNTSEQIQMIIQGYGCSGGNVYSATYNLYTSACGAPISSGNIIGGTLTGLNPGSNYVICYTWQAACSQDTTWPYMWGQSTLPINLVSFEARAARQYIDVMWSTASEVNTSEFIVERTRNGKDFTPVGKLKAAGNSTTLKSYSVRDLNPLEGNNYYRLKEIDFDGSVTTHKLVYAQFARTNNNEIDVIPNPAKDVINIKFPSQKDDQVHVVITDTRGRLIRNEITTAQSEGINFIEFDLSDIPQGIYAVRLFTSEKNLNTRFLKQ